jgi:hypothetical protein
MMGMLAGLASNVLGGTIGNVVHDIKTGKINSLSDFGKSVWEGGKNSVKDTINTIIPGIMGDDKNTAANHALGTNVNTIHNPPKGSASDLRPVIVPTSIRPVVSNQQGEKNNEVDGDIYDDEGNSDNDTRFAPPPIPREKVTLIETNSNGMPGIPQKEMKILDEADIAQYKKLKRKHRKMKRKKYKTKEWK